MIVTSTDGVEGRSIAGYLGIVSGGAVMSTSILYDLEPGFFLSVSAEDKLRQIKQREAAEDERRKAREDELRKAKDAAIGQMKEDARALGADAVVGVDLDYEHFDDNPNRGNRSMLMVTANGTAVRLR